MKIFGFEIKRLGGKPLGGLRETQEAVIDLQARVDRLELHRTKVKIKTIKEEQMDDEIGKILAQGDTRFTPGADSFPEGVV